MTFLLNYIILPGDYLFNLYVTFANTHNTVILAVENEFVRVWGREREGREDVWH